MQNELFFKVNFMMIVSGWYSRQNNDNGTGYGIRIGKEDRDAYFQKEWLSVIIELEKENEIEVVLSKSFWRRCSELRSMYIGRWLLNHNLAPWTKHNPPQLKLMPIGDRKFRLMLNDNENNRTEEPTEKN